MARSTLIRTCAAACVGAALLAIAALVGFVTIVGSDKIADAARDWTFYIPATLALGSAVLLAIGLPGLYLHQEPRLGAFGATGFVLALAGTILAAGGQWTYVFVVPHFAGVTPELVNESTGSVLAGFVLSYAVLALGWILFGLAALRAAVFPRWAALLIVAGAAIAFLPLPSRTLILAIAVGLLGVRLLRGTATTVERIGDPAVAR
jgi:hypothetical protein